MIKPKTTLKQYVKRITKEHYKHVKMIILTLYL